MTARAALLAWTLAVLSLALLAASLGRDAPVRVPLGWSWFILAFLAAGVALVLILTDDARPGGGDVQ